MSSIIKVDTIQNQSGANIISENSNTITVGASGDTTNIIGTLNKDGIAVANTPTFKASRSSNLSIANNSDVKITFTTEDWDTDSAFDLSNNKFTVPSGQAGKYFLNFVTRIRDGANLDLELSFFKNGSKEDRMSFYHAGASEQYQSYEFTTVMNLSASDYIEVYGYQNAGGNLELNGGSVTFFQGFKLIG